MNRKINGYVNFLLENNPSPFCEYIAFKELLKLGELEIRDAYDWAKRFDLYTELLDEQLPDGSWVGGFVDDTTALSKGKKYKATARAITRLRDLSLDVNDSMTARTADLCRKYLKGELVPLDIKKLPAHNVNQKMIITREIYRCLSFFQPDDELVFEYRSEVAEHFKKCCVRGKFDFEMWRQTDFTPVAADFSYESSVQLLSHGNLISEDEQRMLLSYEWERNQFGDVKLSMIMSPDAPLFVFWMRALERFQDFSLLGEFMENDVAPYLYSLCDRLSDPDDNIQINVNRYFGKIGQYSESWNKLQIKKNDLLLRIIRILNKCG